MDCTLMSVANPPLADQQNLDFRISNHGLFFLVLAEIILFSEKSHTPYLYPMKLYELIIVGRSDCAGNWLFDPATGKTRKNLISLYG